MWQRFGWHVTAKAPAGSHCWSGEPRGMWQRFGIWYAEYVVSSCPKLTSGRAPRAPASAVAQNPSTCTPWLLPFFDLDTCTL